ncbi:KilA-N domain-containing protein [Parapedobacter sp.]
MKAIGIRSKSGHYGGTFAHKDIAFEFTAWISIGNARAGTNRLSEDGGTRCERLRRRKVRL